MKTKTKNTETLKEVNVSEATSSTPMADQINAGSVVIAPTSEPKKKLGRPVNPDSARAKRVVEMEAKRIANGGVLPLGRPAVEGSARQIKLQAIADKKADPNYVAKRGRPKMTDEQKVEWKAKREAAIAAFKAGQSSTAALIEQENG